MKGWARGKVAAAYLFYQSERRSTRLGALEDLQWVVARALGKGKHLKHSLMNDAPKKERPSSSVDAAKRQRGFIRRNPDGTRDIVIPPHAVRKVE